jgi:hypothetical protein
VCADTEVARSRREAAVDFIFNASDNGVHKWSPTMKLAFILRPRAAPATGEALQERLVAVGRFVVGVKSS